MKALFVVALLSLMVGASAWTNGYSVHASDPTFADSPWKWVRSYMYNTHDYLAEKAWRMLADIAPEEAAWIREREFFYGTELPDSEGYDESLNDINSQYLSFDADAAAIDDSLAKRAMKRYETVINYLSSGANGSASKWAGAIMSYIQDAGLFSRVIDSPVNGRRFEQNIAWITNVVYPSERFEEKYGPYIKFDGSLELISPYDAIMRIGRASFEGMKDGSCSAEWMDLNYNPDNPDFISCAGRNFNNIINAEIDVLHTLYMAGVKNVSYELYAYEWGNPYSSLPACAELGGNDCPYGCNGTVLNASDSSHCCLGICGRKPQKELSNESPKDIEPDEGLSGGGQKTAGRNTSSAREPSGEGRGGQLLSYIIAILLVAAIALMALLASGDRIRKGEPSPRNSKSLRKSPMRQGHKKAVPASPRRRAARRPASKRRSK